MEDEPPAQLTVRRKVRTTDHLTPGQPTEVDRDVWRSFGNALLAFHHRVYQTGMCRCGRTIIECDVLAQARAHGLLPPLPTT